MGLCPFKVVLKRQFERLIKWLRRKGDLYKEVCPQKAGAFSLKAVRGQDQRPRQLKARQESWGKSTNSMNSRQRSHSTLNPNIRTLPPESTDALLSFSFNTTFLLNVNIHTPFNVLKLMLHIHHKDPPTFWNLLKQTNVGLTNISQPLHFWYLYVHYLAVKGTAWRDHFSCSDFTSTRVRIK